MLKKKGFSLYYFSIGILFIILDDLHLYSPAFVIKIMIIPALIIYYHYQVKDRYNTMHRLVLAGLFFSWTGDIFLQLCGRNMERQIDHPQLFLLGVGAFMLTYLLYIVAFSWNKGENPIFTKRIYLLFAVLLYGAGLLALIYKGLGSDKVPVIIFIFTTLLLLLAALNRHGKVNGVSYMLVSFGALFFVASVSMLAVRVYYEKFDFARILVMASYVLAQYLIALGCIKQNASSQANS
jgi:uncharacterized membrane protein YhhN